MVIAKEILTDFKEIYEKALKLVAEESKNDPPTDPYRSHYDARDLLLQMKGNLKNTLTSIEADEAEHTRDHFVLKVILAFVYRDLGRIYVFTEEVATGEEYLQQCLSLLEGDQLKPEAIIPCVGALNELGIVNANRENFAKSHEALSRAQDAYKAFVGSGLAPLAITDLFGTADEVEPAEGPKELERLYTLCTFYLAQVYGHMDQLEQSASYCHLTLRRQLHFKSFEPIDFALNSATLSQYFIGVNMFREARHHLAAATLIMEQHKETMLKPEMSETERKDVEETYNHRYADVARCWAKYGLALLTASKERLMSDEEEKKLAENMKSLTVDPSAFKFPDLDLKAYEEKVTSDYCLTFDDAKPVYHFVIQWLDIAVAYYKPETEATEYAKVIKDYAELYEYIAFFEEDPANQSKMHKRRAKYLEDLLELLNPVFYLAICRECWYGAGLAHSAILDIQLDSLADRVKSPQDIQKCNKKCHNAIRNFKEFVQSYTDKDGLTIKANVGGEEKRTVVYAFFYLGRLHYKLVSADHRQQLETMSNSLKYYKKFTEECAADKELGEHFRAEVGVCREMVRLLPMKIEAVLKRLNK